MPLARELVSARTLAVSKAELQVGQVHPSGRKNRKQGSA